MFWTIDEAPYVDLYLKLFRAQKKESFAIIAAGDSIVKHALDPVHFDLRILAGLGQLKVLDLSSTPVKEPTLRKLEAALPACTIRH